MGPDLSEDYLGVLKLWVMSIPMKSTKTEPITNSNEFTVVKNFMKNDIIELIVDLFNLDTKLVYRLDKEYPSFCCVIVTHL